MGATTGTLQRRYDLDWLRVPFGVHLRHCIPQSACSLPVARLQSGVLGSTVD